MTTQYIFTRNGVDEKVDLEKWAWGVVYKNNTELHQFSAEGTFHQFKEIDQPNVKMFVMFRTDGVQGRYDMAVTEGMQLFHFYRTLMLEQGGENERKVKVYVFGWKSEAGAVYNYIMPDDRLLTANHDVPDLTVYGI